MANRYVRVYNGPENTNVIGFSASAIPDEKDDFAGFMTGMGYEVEKFERDTPRYEEVIHNLGGVSFGYFGIKPPLRTEDEEALAGWCKKHVDPYHNSGLLIDTRETPMPLEPFNYRSQQLIAEW